MQFHKFPQKMIRHHAFFQALGSLDEGDVAWQPTLAGLAVLRLFDSIAEGPRLDARDDWTTHRAARDAVSAVVEGNPARAILTRILDRLERVSGISEDIGRELLAFGRSLDLEARWELATDVFQTIAKQFSSREYPHLVIESCTALGAVARHAPDWNTSSRAYAQAQHLADAIGDEAASLTVECGIANSNRIRGNLPAAEAELEKIVTEARARGFSQVEALATALTGKRCSLEGQLPAGGSSRVPKSRDDDERSGARQNSRGHRRRLRRAWHARNGEGWLRAPDWLEVGDVTASVGAMAGDAQSHGARSRQWRREPVRRVRKSDGSGSHWTRALRSYLPSSISRSEAGVLGAMAATTSSVLRRSLRQDMSFTRSPSRIEEALEKTPVETEKAGASTRPTFENEGGEGYSVSWKRIAEVLSHLRERATA